MSLHYLRPEDEPRECSNCGPSTPTAGLAERIEECRIACECHGTGRLGAEGKEPDVRVFVASNGWWWYWRNESAAIAGMMGGPYPTESAALAAAREAAGVKS